MMKTYDRLMLVVLDGWGHGQLKSASAIDAANTPFMDSLYKQYPHTELITFGEQVGLPDGQMGNSEVGHLNIGAGRIVYQDLAKINRAIREKELLQNEVFMNTLAYVKEKYCCLHLMGLVSDGGVHSHIDHLKGLIELAENQGVEKIAVHCFTDGRDVDPKSGASFISELLEFSKNKTCKIVSVIGRYYAMDRDKRWERISLAYNLLVRASGLEVKNLHDAILESYEAGVTDEFLKPMIQEDLKEYTIKNNDAVICFNFRTDRCREITTVLTQIDMPEFEMQSLPLKYVTLTKYDDSYKNVDVIFEKEDVFNSLGEVISNAGKTQLRISETEKYPHVTFFFSGGRESVFPGEERIIVPSPKVATYDLQPEMSAIDLTKQAIDYLTEKTPNFICLNYPNADMVGHTGVFEAAVRAVETVDTCLKSLIEQALKKDYAIIVIADHGNSDLMINPDGSPNTAHTTNPVPCILITPDNQILNFSPGGKLGDIAPTVLALLGLDVPPEMSGNIILS